MILHRDDLIAAAVGDQTLFNNANKFRVPNNSMN